MGGRRVRLFQVEQAFRLDESCPSAHSCLSISEILQQIAFNL
jgi:hypothetical protein